MQNPIIRDRRRKRINRFVKHYFFFFIFSFVLSVIDYKTGSVGSGFRPSYYKPTPNTWQFVIDHLPNIVVFSLVAGLLFTLLLPPSNNE